MWQKIKCFFLGHKYHGWFISDYEGIQWCKKCGKEKVVTPKL